MTLAIHPPAVSELLKTVSASRLNTFHTCRLRFYFQYVAKLPKRKSGALHVGSSVHHVLKLWNLARWRNQAIADGWLKSQFDEFWTTDQDGTIQWEEGEEAESKAKAWSLLETYFKESPIPPNEAAEGVEVSVEANLGSTILIGFIDLVRVGGRLVEFKTSATTPSPDRAEHLHENQCSCYATLYRACTSKRESGIELHHLVKLKTPKLVVTLLPPMDQKREARLKRTVESYLNGVQRQDWIPSPNPMTCVGCEFFRQCRNWP